MDESYRNGACRRLCIRRGGRQTDEAIDEGHSPVVEKAGRNPKLRVIFPDEHLMVQLVFMGNGSLACLRRRAEFSCHVPESSRASCALSDAAKSDPAGGSSPSSCLPGLMHLTTLQCTTEGP